VAKLTIDISDKRHERLKDRAEASGCTIGEVIEGDLDRVEDLAGRRLHELLEIAWSNPTEETQRLSDDELMQLGIEIAHEVREEMMREAGSG
jgi:hypothetical protein